MSSGHASLVALWVFAFCTPGFGVRPPCEPCPGWFSCAWDQCCWGGSNMGPQASPQPQCRSVCRVGAVQRRTARWTPGGRRPSVHGQLPHHFQARGDPGCCVHLGLSPSQLLLPGGRGQAGLFWGRRRFHPAALVLGGPEWFWSLLLTTGRGSLAGLPFEGDPIPEGLMFTVRGR